jgi:hypothetical protein
MNCMMVRNITDSDMSKYGDKKKPDICDDNLLSDKRYSGYKDRMELHVQYKLEWPMGAPWALALKVGTVCRKTFRREPEKHVQKSIGSSRDSNKSSVRH